MHPPRGECTAWITPCVNYIIVPGLVAVDPFKEIFWVECYYHIIIVSDNILDKNVLGVRPRTRESPSRIYIGTIHVQYDSSPPDSINTLCWGDIVSMVVDDFARRCSLEAQFEVNGTYRNESHVKYIHIWGRFSREMAALELLSTNVDSSAVTNPDIVPAGILTPFRLAPPYGLRYRTGVC